MRPFTICAMNKQMPPWLTVLLYCCLPLLLVSTPTRQPQGALTRFLLSYINVFTQYIPVRHSDNISTHIVYSATWENFLQLFIPFHSIGMCRMRRFPSILSSFFHSSLLCTILFATLLHQLFFHLLSPHLAIYFLVYLSILLFPNSYIMPFWEFYFLPLSVHAQTNIIYLTLLSLL